MISICRVDQVRPHPSFNRADIRKIFAMIQQVAGKNEHIFIIFKVLKNPNGIVLESSLKPRFIRT